MELLLLHHFDLQMWLEAANRHLDFIIKHKPGSELLLADALSRYNIDKSKASLADLMIREKDLRERTPVVNNRSLFDFTL